MLISYLLVRGLSSGINPSVSNRFFHGLSHACAWTLSAETKQKGEYTRNRIYYKFAELGVKEEGNNDVSTKYFTVWENM